MASWISTEKEPPVIKWAPGNLMFATGSSELSFWVPDLSKLGTYAGRKLSWEYLLFGHAAVLSTTNTDFIMDHEAWLNLSLIPAWLKSAWIACIFKAHWFRLLGANMLCNHPAWNWCFTLAACCWTPCYARNSQKEE